MSKSNDIDPPEIDPDHEPPENRQRGEVKFLNAMLAEETVLYAHLRDYQRKILRAKSENRNREGRQVEANQRRDQEDMG